MSRLKGRRYHQNIQQVSTLIFPFFESGQSDTSLGNMQQLLEGITPRLDNEKKDMKTVAVIGASNDRKKYGNKAVRAFLQRGYTVYPVNPNETEVEGLPAYGSIKDVPERPQMVSLYVPPPVVERILPEIAQKGCDELWMNPGTESDAGLAEAERLGLKVVQACSIVAVGVSPSRL